MKRQWQEDLIVRSDNPGIDAFGHLRVSLPQALFAVLSQYDAEPLAMESGFTGTGVTPAHVDDLRMCQLSAGAGTGTSYIQSYAYWSYQPGRSQRIDMTGRFGTPVAGVTTDYGYFDAANGIFYRQDGINGVQWAVRSSTSGGAVDTVVGQADWNLDKLDGNGPSGLSLDPTKVFLMTIDLEFLGMGRVRVGFNIGGQVFYVHEFLHTNLATVPYMQTATLPLQVLLTATSTAAPAEAFFKGALVSSEGGLLKELGFIFATPERTVTAADGVRMHLLSLRPKTLFNGLTNREFYITNSLELLLTTGAKSVFWELVVGANFSVAPTWSDVNTDFSGTEISTGGTFSNLTGGVVLKAGYADVTDKPCKAISIPLDLRHALVLNRAGQNTAIGTLSLLVTGIGGVNACRAAMNISELR